MFSFFSSSSSDPDKLLKEATAKKKSGDINVAIEIIRKAYKEIAKTNISYSTETFLKLPMYLLEAGRNDEAWKEFNILLINGYPNQTKTRGLLPMHNSIVYDKMRLFLQREGRNLEAVKFGVMSYISWLDGLCKQKRKEEYESMLAIENIERIIGALLKKANKTDKKAKISQYIIESCKKITNINVVNIADNILEILKI